jgi:DNA-binding MarR family transcriptional regulator
MDFNYSNSFVYWIGRLSQLMQESFNNFLSEKLQERKISWSQWLLVNHLGNHPGAMPAEIADAIQIDRSAVTRLLDRLEQKELLYRAREGLDRRVLNVYLTGDGEKLLKEVNVLAEEHQASFLKAIPTTELRILKTDIQKMLKVGGVDSQSRWKSM